MLSFNNLSLRRGSNLLFEKVSFTVHKDNKVGLVGANGTGKTSLFKMMQGEFDSDEGTFKYPPDLKIACLAQEVPGTDEQALAYVIGGDKKLVEIEKAISTAEINEDYGSLGELHSQYEDHDGFWFCSEQRFLIENMVSPEMAVENLAELLSFRYVHAPRTLIKKLSVIPAGHHLQVQEDGRQLERALLTGREILNFTPVLS